MMIKTALGERRLYEEPGYAQPASIVSSHSGPMQGFLLYCGTFPEAPFSEMVVELRDPASRQTPVFLEVRTPEASVETPAAREPAKLPPKNRAKPNTKS